MAEQALRLKLSHLMVRSIAIFNIITLALDVFYPAYHQMQSQWDIDSILVWWYFASSLILPLYVGIGIWWASRKAVLESKEFSIDAWFAAAWFLTWWGGLLYAWVTYSPL